MLCYNIVLHGYKGIILTTNWEACGIQPVSVQLSYVNCWLGKHIARGINGWWHILLWKWKNSNLNWATKHDLFIVLKRKKKTLLPHLSGYGRVVHSHCNHQLFRQPIHARGAAGFSATPPVSSPCLGLWCWFYDVGLLPIKVLLKTTRTHFKRDPLIAPCWNDFWFDLGWNRNGRPEGKGFKPLNALSTELHFVCVCVSVGRGFQKLLKKYIKIQYISTGLEGTICLGQ